MNQIKTILGDNMDVMPLYSDNYFDFAIVDPMYGLKANSYRNKQSQSKLAKVGDKNLQIWDYPPPGQEYFDELFRISKHQIIWGGNYFTDHLPPSMCWIVWDKVNQKASYADIELAWCSMIKAARLFRYMWNGMNQGSRSDGAIMEGNKKLNEKRIHPCQKPIQLYRWIFTKFAIDRRHKIIDTHLGSGNIAIAASEFGIDFTGIEIDEKVFNDANENIQKEIKKEITLKINYEQQN